MTKDRFAKLAQDIFFTRVCIQRSLEGDWLDPESAQEHISNVRYLTGELQDLLDVYNLENGVK